jgi:hypothetical protein
MVTNPLDFPRYVRSLRPSLPESLPTYVEDELEKVSTSLQELEEAANNHAEARVEEERIVRVSEDEALAARIVTVEAEFDAGLAETNARIATEEISRASADEAIASRVSELEADFTTSTAELTARVSTEELARAAQDEVLAARIDTVEATRQEGETALNARISHENAARVSQDTALASSITSLSATVSSNTAAITAEATTRANADTALSSSITSLTSTVNSNTAAISSEATTRANADTALSNSITSLTTTVNSNTAAITAEQTARSNADSAITSNVTSLTTTVSGHTSTLTSYGTSISGLQAKYGVKLDVNGYVSGFEQNNGSGTSDFIITADKFKIVMPSTPGATPVVPFEVSAGTVKINGNLIVNGTITATQIGDGEVPTDKLAANAASLASSAFTAGNATYSASTWTTVQSLTVTSVAATGSATTIRVGMYLSALATVSLDLKIRVQRDGVTVGSEIPIPWVTSGSIRSTAWTGTFCFTDTPSAGSHTYDFQVYSAQASDGGSNTVNNRYLEVVELKR